MTPTNINAKSLESWIWDAACSIHGAKDAPKYNDYKFSPSHYIHNTNDAETYRPLAEIVADLDTVETEAREADAALWEILRKIGV